MAIRVLVAGRSGQVARSLAEAAAEREEFELVCLGRPELDIADRASVDAALAEQRPDLVINAAAYTAVDQAESDRDNAYLGNEKGPLHLALATAALDIPVFHLSTDYVFNGRGQRPYREDDETSPLGVYGASKLAGERRVAGANPRHLILRTAWVYGAHGRNFLKTMLRVGEGRDTLSVVADQRGAPTSSHDIAEALLSLAAAVSREGDGAAFGVYHMASRGEGVWADFAEAIFEESAARGGPVARVDRIPTSEYPTPAERPAYSVLDSSRLERQFGVRLPDWREPVGTIVERVLREKDWR